MTTNTATDDYTSAIAGAVRAEFARHGKKLLDLAPVLGLSRPTTSGRWWGRTPYTTTELDKVAQFLGIDPYELSESAARGARNAERSPDSLDVTKPARDPLAQPARSRAKRGAA